MILFPPLLVWELSSLYLLQKLESQEVTCRQAYHARRMTSMRIWCHVAGLLVVMMDSRIPDLVIGVIIFAIVGRGAFRILELSK